MSQVHIFGVRHHGPGSARRLVEALEALDPGIVLIEGPADASDILPMLADPEMKPPVALLGYANDAASDAVFWPFATFSPEYQAVIWAVRHNRPVEFIDLPVSWRLGEMQQQDIAVEDEASDPEGQGEQSDTSGDDDGAEAHTAQAQNEPPDKLSDTRSKVDWDPIGVLAEVAGYEDGESWWRDVIEENPQPGPVFEAVADAMTALREAAAAPDERELAREAHMRLAINKAAKSASGPVAVVCGAWHVPALKARHALKDDRALLKGAPKRKISTTWTPWTTPRLANASGYSAGVTAPGWCAHVWHSTPAHSSIRWLTSIAVVLREAGHSISTASLIEADRMGRALAVVRGRPQPGFEELRDAAIAVLCFGNSTLWDSVAAQLLVGSGVGSVPESVPHAPLLDDLQRQQKAARLKPEALEKELAVDLRTDSGLFRSTLLHRLNFLGVSWGKLTDAGKSRGTFRERWVLRWEPEYSVAVVENTIWGPTIELAANGKVSAQLATETSLSALATTVRDAMTAQLGAAVELGIEQLSHKAALTSDSGELLGALPPMADLLRYGEARTTDATQLEALMHRLVVQSALALPYAARALDTDAANLMRNNVKAADAAIQLAIEKSETLNQWYEALQLLLDDSKCSPLVAGAVAQILYTVERLQPADAAILLQRALSPGVEVAQAAAFFEGFFDGAGQRLLYDAELRTAVDEWLCQMDEETFVEHLPLLRRVLSGLDTSERSRLLDQLLGRAEASFTSLVLSENASTQWPPQLEVITEILTAAASSDNT